MAVEPACVLVLGGERVPSSGDQLGVALDQCCSAKDKTVLSRALPPVLRLCLWVWFVFLLV